MDNKNLKQNSNLKQSQNTSVSTAATTATATTTTSTLNKDQDKSFPTSTLNKIEPETSNIRKSSSKADGIKTQYKYKLGPTASGTDSQQLINRLNSSERYNSLQYTNNDIKQNTSEMVAIIPLPQIQQTFNDFQDFSCLEGYRVIDLARYLPLPQQDYNIYQYYQVSKKQTNNQQRMVNTIPQTIYGGNDFTQILPNNLVNTSLNTFHQVLPPPIQVIDNVLNTYNPCNNITNHYQYINLNHQNNTNNIASNVYCNQSNINCSAKQQLNYDSTVFLMNNGEAVSVREFSLFSWDFYKQFQMGNTSTFNNNQNNQNHFDYYSQNLSFDNLKKIYAEEEKKKFFWQCLSSNNSSSSSSSSRINSTSSSVQDTNSTRVISPIDDTSFYPNLNLSEALKANKSYGKDVKSGTDNNNLKLYKPKAQKPPNLPFTSGFDYSLSILRMPNSCAPVETVRKRNFPVKLTGIGNIEKSNLFTINDILPIIGYQNQSKLPPHLSENVASSNSQILSNNCSNSNVMINVINPIEIENSKKTNLNDNKNKEYNINLHELLQFLDIPQNHAIDYDTLKWERPIRSLSPKKIEDYSHLEIENKKQRYPITNLYSGPVLEYLKKMIQKQRDEINSIPETVLHYPLEIRANPITFPNTIISLEDKIDRDEGDRNTYAFLYGIPKTEINENIGAIVGRAFAIAMVDIQTCLKIRRFPCNSINPNQPQMISLQFTSRQTRTNFVWQFNSKKVTVTDFQCVLNLRKLPNDMIAENVFARESLTAKNRELFDKAKTLKHLKLIENAFTYDGIVYVFINTWTTSLRINNLIELELAVMQQQKEKRLLRYNWLEHWRRSGLNKDEFFDWVRRRDRIYLDLMLF